MGLLGITSSLWKSLVGSDSSFSSKEGRDDTTTVTVERDTRTEHERASAETRAAVKEPIGETESTDKMAGEKADAESHADDEDTRDDVEVAANVIEETEPEDETIKPKPESEPEVKVEVEIDGRPEAGDEPELEDEDEESGGAGAEDEESGNETADNADVPTVDRVRGIGPAYVERFSGIGIETIAGLATADTDKVGDETDMSLKCVQCQIDRAGDT